MNPILSFPVGSKVTIRREEEQPPRDCSLVRLQSICSELFYQTINLFAFKKTFPNIAAMQKAVLYRDALLPKMDFPFFVKAPRFFFSNHPDITKAIFKPHRDDALFLTDNESPVSIYKLIEGMLQDPELTKDDLMFTCSPKETSKFRGIVLRVLSKNPIEEFRPVMETLVNETVQEWHEKGSFDLSDAVHRFTCRALAKVLLGLEDEAGELATSMRQFFDYISSIFLQQPIDSGKIAAARKRFFEMTEQGLKEGDGIAQKIAQEEGLTLHAQKMLIFSLLFSGTDSVVSSLTYCILKCAQNDYSETDARKCIAEGLRMYPPVIGVSRIAKEDLLLTISHGDRSVEWRIPQGSHLYTSQNQLARCPVLFPNEPERFKSDRFEEVPSFVSLPWMPLGSGKHVCPGASLYELISETLISALLSKGKLSTTFQGEPTQTGHFINKLVEKIRVSFAHNPY